MSSAGDSILPLVTMQHIKLIIDHLYMEYCTLIMAPADGRTSGPTLVTREVMKRAAPTLVLRPTPRLTYSAHARDSL